MTEEEIQKLATAITKQNGALADVTPETAKQRLDNLKRFDVDWGQRFMAGELKATQEFNALTEMIHQHDTARADAELKTATEAWNKEQADREAADAAKNAAEKEEFAKVLRGESV